jgi:hypothetical protein
MSTLTKNNLTSRIRRVTFQADLMRVHLEDGQVLVVPIRLYPRLIAGGKGINWPDLDEDISLQGLLARQPSSESAKSVLKWLQARQLKHSPTPTLLADIQLLAPPK